MSFSEVMCDPPSTVSQAARVGNLQQLKSLIQQGHAVDVSDNRGWKALHEAAYGNHIDCLRELLKSEVTDVNWRSHEQATALLLASQERNVQCVEELLKAGANPNLCDYVNTYPLLEAVKSRCMEIIELLVEHGADLNCQLYCGTTPLHHAASEGMTQIVSYLLKNGARLEMEEEYRISTIFSAAQHGHEDCLRLMLGYARERDQEYLINWPADDGATPLYLAAQNGHIECVQTLLENGADANIYTLNEPKALPLLAAIEFANMSCISALMPATDLRYLDKCDVSPWYMIFCNGDYKKRYEMAKILVDAGADPNYQHAKDMNEVYTRFPKILRFLPTESMLFYKSITPLTKASYFESAHHSSRLIELLIQNGGYVNAQSIYEMAPILPALENGKMAILKKLMEHGVCVDIYHPNVQGNVAVLLCLHRWKSFAFLLHNGAEFHSIFDEVKYMHHLYIYKQKVNKWHNTSKNYGGCIICRPSSPLPSPDRNSHTVCLSIKRKAAKKIETSESAENNSDDINMKTSKKNCMSNTEEKNCVIANEDSNNESVHNWNEFRCYACKKIREALKRKEQSLFLRVQQKNTQRIDQSDDETSSENCLDGEEDASCATEAHICGGAYSQQKIIDEMNFIPNSTFFMAARQVMGNSPYNVSVGQVLIFMLQYGGTINIPHSVLAYIDRSEERRKVLDIMETPRTMAHLCRVTVRRCMGTNRIYNQHETRKQLALPRHIMDFIFMSEMEDPDWCF